MTPVFCCCHVCRWSHWRQKWLKIHCTESNFLLFLYVCHLTRLQFLQLENLMRQISFFLIGCFVHFCLCFNCQNLLTLIHPWQKYFSKEYLYRRMKFQTVIYPWFMMWLPALVFSHFQHKLDLKIFFFTSFSDTLVSLIQRKLFL